MKNIILLVLVVVVAWYGYTRYQRHAPISSDFTPPAFNSSAPEGRFRCDGRIYCSQMASCAEATFFLRNCPGTKMDGDHDGIPCESQWCK